MFAAPIKSRFQCREYKYAIFANAMTQLRHIFYRFNNTLYINALHLRYFEITVIASSRYNYKMCNRREMTHVKKLSQIIISIAIKIK